MPYRAITIVLQIIAPVGVLLPAVVAAQTELGASSSTYALNDLGGSTSFAIKDGVVIQTPSGNAITGSDADWQLVNLGTIRSLDFGNGIDFQGGASLITNGSAKIAGDIGAFHNGINVNGDVTVHNLGASTIWGGDSGIIVEAGGLTLLNTGTIRGFNPDSEMSMGVYVWDGGGTMTNAPGAVIEGTHQGASYADTQGELGNIDNYGTIRASLGMAANTDRGTITNHATGEIAGGLAGVQIGTGTLVNLGTVTANGQFEDGKLLLGNGVRINGEGKVDNRSGGTISGVGNGIAIDWMTTVINAGTIEATGTAGNGIQFAESGEGKIINSGSITGGADGYAIHSLSSYSSELVLLPGSRIAGLVEMGSSDADRLTFSGTTAASVSGLEHYRNFEIGSIEHGADWTLDGTLAIAELTNAGTLQAGTVDKSFGINGTYVQTESGVLQVISTADGASSKLTATAADLAGGVHVNAGKGQWRQGTDYTIVEADTLTGQFSGSTTDLAFLTPILVTDSTSVTMTLSRNDVALADVATTAQQRAVAAALAGAKSDALTASVEAQSAAGAQRAFDALVGDIFSSLDSQAIAQTGQLGVVMLDRMRAHQGGAASAGPMAANAYMAQPESAASAAASGLSTGQANAPQIEIWSQGYGGVGNGSATHWSNGGVVAGIDVSHDAGRVGVGGNIARGVVEHGNSTADIDSYSALAYASHTTGLLALRGGASLGLNTISTERHVTFAGFSEQLNARYGGSTGRLFGEVGISLPVAETATIEPYAGLAYGHMFTGAAQETGGSAALSVAAADLAWLTATVGIRAAATLTLSDSMNITPRLGVAWQSNHGNAATTSQAFSGGPSFTVTGTGVASDVLLVDLGVDFGLPAQLGLSLDYNGSLMESGTNHQFRLQMGKAF